MTDLKQIIEEAFQAGWEANDKISKRIQEAGNLSWERSYGYYQGRCLDYVDDLPPILTREIFDEIVRAVHGEEWCECPECQAKLIKLDDLLKKYNLEPKDER